MGVAISVPVESLKTILDRIYRIVKTVIRKIARALRGPLLFQEPGREPEEEKRGTGEKERRNVDQHHRHSGHHARGVMTRNPASPVIASHALGVAWQSRFL